MRPAQAGIYLPVGAETGGVTALVLGKADGRVWAAWRNLLALSPE